MLSTVFLASWERGYRLLSLFQQAAIAGWEAGMYGSLGFIANSHLTLRAGPEDKGEP